MDFTSCRKRAGKKEKKEKKEIWECGQESSRPVKEGVELMDLAWGTPRSFWQRRGAASPESAAQRKVQKLRGRWFQPKALQGESNRAASKGDPFPLIPFFEKCSRQIHFPATIFFFLAKTADYYGKSAKATCTLLNNTFPQSKTAPFCKEI